jgi:hypothetical protein
VGHFNGGHFDLLYLRVLNRFNPRAKIALNRFKPMLLGVSVKQN